MWRLLTEHGAVCIGPDGTVCDGPRPAALLSGSFNPLHHGHIALAAAATKHLGVTVHFELSVQNVDKPELAPEEAARRVARFAGVAPVWLTRAATFAAKAALFPGAAFVLGYDTAVRLIDSKYYGDESGRDECLHSLLASGCRVVVGGRIDAGGAFRTWDAGDFGGLFVPLTEADFRVDVSSTELRG